MESVATVALAPFALTRRRVTEIQLVSQNTSDFGRDTGQDLLSLVTALNGIDGLNRRTYISMLYEDWQTWLTENSVLSEPMLQNILLPGLSV